MKATKGLCAVVLGTFLSTAVCANTPPGKFTISDELLDAGSNKVAKYVILYGVALYVAKVGSEKLVNYLRTKYTRAGRHEAVKKELEKVKSIISLQLPIMRTLKRTKSGGPLSEENINAAIRRDLGFCMEINLALHKSESIVDGIIKDINTSAKDLDDLALLNECHKTKSELLGLTESVKGAATQIKSLKS